MTSSQETPKAISKRRIRKKEAENTVSSVECPNVMFTGITDEKRAEAVARLGGTIASSIEDCTHLVTDKVRRTTKFLSALGKGVFIVTPAWIDKSKKSSHFVDESEFLVSDSGAESQWHFNLDNSLKIARSCKFMSNWNVYATQHVKLPHNELKDILFWAGAKLVTEPPRKKEENMIIVGSEEDQEELDDYVQLGYDVYTLELIVVGILQQKLDFSKNILLDHNNPGVFETSTKRLRRKRSM